MTGRNTAPEAPGQSNIEFTVYCFDNMKQYNQAIALQDMRIEPMGYDSSRGDHMVKVPDEQVSDFQKRMFG